ncbi:DUF3611 family protein [Oxynema aestuarii]|jgi:hypothetical protein|uniref:DUF3611 family protein n=1 Tax=Oxynema aestuarii AP17 TaxID=2064643 RepID=A0A6H1TXP9_9CYAN|nr:DUF3611 family protein [Oxynema aestuarii]QIZ71364.1 DUF3611 family protein [Oxynema aestuarii AP17]RMH73391.1 MAG: DUF3611 family protein [Cyanobacteria bacterium J007]
MPDNSDLPALPPTVRRVIPALRRVGWISFWVQLVLAVVAGLIFLFSIPLAIPRDSPTTVTRNPGAGPGTFFAVLGLVALGISIYWAFRYTRLAKQLEATNPNLRPKKADTVKLIRRGLMVNLVGMLLALLGAEAINGTLLAKSLSSQGIVFSDPSALSRFIQPLDIFLVLGNTHTIVAHFAGLVTALWLLNWIDRQTQA